jgi:hypothetical protein
MTRRPHRRTIDHLPSGGIFRKINRVVAVGITRAVGTMWCAYIFCLISLTSLPSVLALHSVNADVSWVAQTFLQLVLLSVIIVGQNISAEASDARAAKTFEDTEAILDRLDISTAGGLKEIADRIDRLEGINA